MDALDNIKAGWKEQAVPDVDIEKLLKRVKRWNSPEYGHKLSFFGGVATTVLGLATFGYMSHYEARPIYGLCMMLVLWISSFGFLYRAYFLKKYQLKDQPLVEYLRLALKRTATIRITAVMLAVGQGAFLVGQFFIGYNDNDPKVPMSLLLVVTLIFLGIIFLGILGAAVVYYQKFYTGKLSEIEKDLKQVLKDLGENP